MTAPPASRLQMGARLYAALRCGDVAVLRELLSDDFRGQLTAGLPLGFGDTTYQGREAMLSDGWGAVGQHFDLVPELEELLDGGAFLIGRGYYVGVAKRTQNPVRAAFAHFWRLEGGRITEVVQVTDSALWHKALEG